MATLRRTCAKVREPSELRFGGAWSRPRHWCIRWGSTSCKGNGRLFGGWGFVPRRLIREFPMRPCSGAAWFIFRTARRVCVLSLQACRLIPRCAYGDRSLVRNSPSSFGDYIAVRYPLAVKNKFAAVLIKPPRGRLRGVTQTSFQITLGRLVVVYYARRQTHITTQTYKIKT